MARVNNKARVIERLEKLLDEASALDPHEDLALKFKKWTANVYNLSFIFLVKIVVYSLDSQAVTQ